MYVFVPPRAMHPAKQPINTYKNLLIKFVPPRAMHLAVQPVAVKPLDDLPPRLRINV